MTAGHWVPGWPIEAVRSAEWRIGASEHSGGCFRASTRESTIGAYATGLYVVYTDVCHDVCNTRKERQLTLRKCRWFDVAVMWCVAFRWSGFDSALCRCKIPLAHASSTRSQPVGLTACVSVYLRVWVAVGVCGCTTAEYRARAPGRLKSGGHCTRELALTHGRTVAAATETHAQAHELYM